MLVKDRQHVPDILDCLAQLSSDEVPTPPKLARAMLDLLPGDVWSDPELRWLDPFCKSGVFLREIVSRLLNGLAEWESDFEKRREHIFRNMVFGAAITEITGYISRRTVYYSRDASGEHSVVRFVEEAGNLPFVPAEHDFKKGRCQVCGAPEDLERGDTRENYAYAFLHGAYPTKEMEDMKSPESYFQAAFRVQSPWAYRDAEGELDVRKPTCYVFEFDPNRALLLLAEYGIRLAAESDETPSAAIGKLLNYLPIFGFFGGSMLPLDASAVLDWATAGTGATALAQRWNSPLLVDVNERTLSAVLEHPGLLKTLEQIEDFRALVNNAEHVVTSTKMLKKAKREQGGKLEPGQKREQSETAKQRKEIREKLQKFLARIPVFMYATDFREEALKHVIESLDPALFERVTGLTIEDFKLLSDLGLFHARNMDAAIYQFRLFERASLRYADDNPGGSHPATVGLWNRSVRSDELGQATAPSP